ncbi:MAG TPA: FKBP-type peptidyl-prolyl cis-trans isomerase, partial [Chitinophagaceae bacterium]|nr:FKBP-type peptidyl-prolyl cis-trans isomerase [Chitinophagaceae bacterium]
MKQIILMAAALGVSVSMVAQTKAKPTAKPVAGAVTAPVMKTGLDSLSYSLGMSLAQFYKQQGITKVNTTLVSKAINDALSGSKTLLDEEQMNSCITNYLQQMKSEKASGNKKAGEEFLAANKSKPGVVSLPSGLQYIILQEGTGPKPSLTDTVKCHYHGTLLDGRVFDSSVDRGQPAEFPVGAVIKGWVEALPLMSVGSKWKLFIPSDLAYGDTQAGPTIGPGSTLVFDVELLD